MKSQPKLKDTLDIFLEELDTLQNSIGEIKKINPILDEKIKLLKQIRIEPETKELKQFERFFFNELSDKTAKMDTLFSKSLTRMKEISEEHKKGKSEFYKYVLLFFIITALSIFFAVNTHSKQSNLKKEIQKISSYNHALETYLKESKQIEKYNKWLGEKKTK